MKQYLFIILFLFPSLVFSQTNSWFSTDQQWYYHYGSFFISGFDELTITGEVPIHSFNCTEVQSRKKTQNLEFPTYDIDPSGGDIENHYIYEQNDSVFYYNSDDDEFELMYDFNMQVGDRMTVFHSPEVGLDEDSIIIEIDSLGVMDIDGSPLRFQRVNIITHTNGFPENILGQTFILEKLGVVNLTENYFASHLILKYALISYGLFEQGWNFRCYSDNNISYQPLGTWCDRLSEGYWLVPNASWCYDKSINGGSGFSQKKISLKEQVFFQNHNPPILWKATQETRTTFGGQPSVNQDSFYLYERDARLFQVSYDLSSTKMLYNLNWEQSDTILLPDPICNESYILIDSIGQVVIDAVPLRKLYCTAILYDTDNSVSYGRSFEITSRLGAFDLDYIGDLICVTDIESFQFVDYSDSQININPDECLTIIVSNDEFISNENISISPIPSSDFIQIKSDVNIQEIKIMDASGKLIQTIQNDFEILDIRHFSKGIYFLNIISKEGSQLTKKIIKN